MGATKRIAEAICKAFNYNLGKTEYISVRFGNVLGSRGSVFTDLSRTIEARRSADGHASRHMPLFYDHPGSRFACPSGFGIREGGGGPKFWIWVNL